MTDMAQITGVLLTIGVICRCVLIGGHGLPRFRRGRTTCRATSTPEASSRNAAPRV